MAEHEKRKAARALMSRTGYSVGGHLSTHHKKYATKHDIVEAVAEHEGHLHKHDPKTRIKLASGGIAEGMKSKMRGDKKGRGHTTVNVVMANHPHPRPQPVPVPVPAGGPGGAPMGPMAGGPPMPPPGMAGAGGPPPMAHGGRAYKKGGRVEMEAGSGGGLGRLEKADEYGAKTGAKVKKLPMKRK